MKTRPISFTHWYRRIMGNACPLLERRTHRFSFKVPQFRFGCLVPVCKRLRADVADIYSILDDVPLKDEARRRDIIVQLDAMPRDAMSMCDAVTMGLLVVRIGSEITYVEMPANMLAPGYKGIPLMLHGDVWVDITNHSDDNLDVAVSLGGWQPID